MAKRKNLSQKTRFEVFKRDSFTCQYCGGTAPTIVLQVDHIHPVAKGGTNDLSNLVTSCHDCNLGKSDRLLSDRHELEKQRAELELLNERREQLEFLKVWRDECVGIGDKEVDLVQSVFVDAYGDDKLFADSFRRSVKRFIKKYGIGSVLSQSERVCEVYHDIEKACSKLECFLRNEEADRNLEGSGRIGYVIAVMRNKRILGDYTTTITNLCTNALKAGVKIEWIIEVSKRATSYRSFISAIHERIVEVQE